MDSAEADDAAAVAEPAGEAAESPGVDLEVSRRGRPKKSLSSSSPAAQVRSSYGSTFQDEKREGEFAVGDIVWGKVRSHPWWPGQVVDSADASEMALRQRHAAGKVLVAYFGDGTFAWNDAAALRSFRAEFAAMARKSREETFVEAVDASLDEAARRVEVALSCRCHKPDELAIQPEVLNAGVKEGVLVPTVDSSFIRDSFLPSRFHRFLTEMAQLTMEEVDRLELVTFEAQLRAFNRWRGFLPLPPVFVVHEDTEDKADVINDAKLSTGDEVGQIVVDKISELVDAKGPEKGETPLEKESDILEGRRKKKKVSELMDETDVKGIGHKRGSSSRRSSGQEDTDKKLDSAPAVKSMRKRKVESLGSVETKSGMKSEPNVSKFGDCIRRAAEQLSNTPPVVMTNGADGQASLGKGKRKRKVDTSDSTPAKMPNGEGSIEKNSASYRSCGELLSQLCVVATDPTKGEHLEPEIRTFFTDFKANRDLEISGDKETTEGVRSKRVRRLPAKFTSDYAMLPSTVSKNVVRSSEKFFADSGLESADDKDSAAARSKSGRRKRAKKNAGSDDQHPDSYWPDIVVNEEDDGQRTDEKDLNAAGSKGTADAVSADAAKEETPLAEANKTDGHSDDAKDVRNEIDLEGKAEASATLSLHFDKPGHVPSEKELLDLFGKFGEVKLLQSDVDNKASAKVFFEKFDDAEKATSDVEKWGFGSSLISYQLSLSCP